MTTKSFNLIDEPWIPVLSGSVPREVSIREALVEAEDISGLDFGSPLEAVAILRQVLLPIVFHACGLPRTNDEWAELWDQDGLPTQHINPYLDRHYERFWLFHPSMPFGQVASLRTTNAETKSAALLLASEPSGNNFPLFGWRSDATPLELTPAQAVRGLLATHCFDTAGIKTGADGDPKMAKGKTAGNPIGPTGQGAVLVPTGASLAESIKLNTPIVPQGLAENDLPVFIREPLSVAWEERPATGICDLLTFQARRIRLFPHPGYPARNAISRALVSAGDRLPTTPESEIHFQWRLNTKPKPGEPARRPASLRAGRAMWRGLTSLIACNPNSNGDQTSVLLTQLGDLVADGLINDSFQSNIISVGVVYGTQNSIVEEVVVDAIPLPVTALLEDRETHLFLLEMADSAEKLRKAANELDDSLRRASGGDATPWDKAQRLGEVLISQLDVPAHRILAALSAHPEKVEQAEIAWANVAREMALELLEVALLAVPPTAFAGRPGKSPKFPDRASNAEAQFRFQLNQIVPTPTLNEVETPNE